ncbi:hypothetical protein Ancab_028979 [Ancistrocladus abbreviatus]
MRKKPFLRNSSITKRGKTRSYAEVVGSQFSLSQQGTKDTSPAGKQTPTKDIRLNVSSEKMDSDWLNECFVREVLSAEKIDNLEEELRAKEVDQDTSSKSNLKYARLSILTSTSWNI